MPKVLLPAKWERANGTKKTIRYAVKIKTRRAYQKKRGQIVCVWIISDVLMKEEIKQLKRIFKNKGYRN